MVACIYQQTFTLPTPTLALWEEYTSQPSYGFAQKTFFANGIWVNMTYVQAETFSTSFYHSLSSSPPPWRKLSLHNGCSFHLGPQNERIYETDLNPVHSLEPSPEQPSRAEQSYNQPVNTWVRNKYYKPLKFGGCLLLQEKLTNIYPMLLKGI